MPSATEPAARRARAPLLLGVAALLWSGNFVLGRAVAGRIPPVALAFWRWAVALAVLLPLTLRGVRDAAPALRRSWKILVPLGILGVGNFNLLVYVGLTGTSATNALLLNSACPAFILGLSFAAGLERPGPRQLAGIAVSLAGVVTIVTRGAPATVLSVSFARGDLWVLAAVLSWAAYTILLARRPAGVEPLPLLAVLIAIGLLWIAPFYALELARGARLHLDAASAGAILYVALFASLAAYALWNAGVAAVGASHAGVFLHLMPAFGAVLAALLLGESFRAFHAAGIALILAGVTLAGAVRPARARR
ncbi:MAG TPA: DMT family transporter [Anaeromyxobacter sp.]